MSGRSDTRREEIIRHLKRRSSLSGGIVYMTRSARHVVEKTEAPAPAAGEMIVKTSPVKPPAEDVKKTVSGREMKEGFTRDTRPSSNGGLFAADGKGTDVLDVGLAELEKMVAGCTKCGLHETRTNAVFGDGSPSARLVFIGEAPGRDEDLQGVPFVGRAGKLLDKMIAAIDFSRENVYIANILKCRPPGNRNPKEDEITSCEKYLARQIELIDPVLICALGRVAGQNLLGARAPLHVLRKGIHHYNGIRVVVTYHPAALLRNPNWKKGAWEDLQMLRELHDELTGAGRE
jgi:DNA polymerase